MAGNYGYGELIKINGLAELQTKLTAFGEKISDKVVQQGLNDGAEIMKKEAARRTRFLNQRKNPDGTPQYHLLKVDGVYKKMWPGNLSKNIRRRQIRKHEEGVKKSEVYVYGKFAWYGKFVEGTEMGTSRQPPTPFMRPTYESKEAEAVQAFENRIAKAVKDGGL